MGDIKYEAHTISSGTHLLTSGEYVEIFSRTNVWSEYEFTKRSYEIKWHYNGITLEEPEVAAAKKAKSERFQARVQATAIARAAALKRELHNKWYRRLFRFLFRKKDKDFTAIVVSDKSDAS